MSGWTVKADDTIRPVQDLDKDRQPPPQNPTGNPIQKPMPLGDLLKLIETSAKSLFDCGPDLEKSFSAISKVKSMGGSTESERHIIDKASEVAIKISALKESAAKIADDLSAWRGSLAAGTPTAKRKSRWFGR